jgi:hypothetical protein
MADKICMQFLSLATALHKNGLTNNSTRGQNAAVSNNEAWTIKPTQADTLHSCALAAAQLLVH